MRVGFFFATPRLGVCIFWELYFYMPTGQHPDATSVADWGSLTAFEVAPQLELFTSHGLPLSVYLRRLLVSLATTSFWLTSRLCQP